MRHAANALQDLATHQTCSNQNAHANTHAHTQKFWVSQLSVSVLAATMVLLSPPLPLQHTPLLARSVSLCDLNRTTGNAANCDDYLVSPLSVPLGWQDR